MSAAVGDLGQLIPKIAEEGGLPACIPQAEMVLYFMKSLDETQIAEIMTSGIFGENQLNLFTQLLMISMLS